MKEFEGKVAIVTGTTGIGRAIAKRLAWAGANVMACGIDADANNKLQEEANAQGYVLCVELCDVSRPEQVRELVAKVVIGVKFVDGEEQTEQAA